MKAAIWSPTAKQDLDRVWLAVARHDIAAADRIIASVETRVELLREFPHIGSPTAANRRKLVIDRFPDVLHYAVTDAAILILALRHMARGSS